MNKLAIFFIGLMCSTHALALVQERSLICSTPRLEYKMVIQQDQISLDRESAGRQLASVIKPTVQQIGSVKNVFFKKDHLSAQLHLGDLKEFAEVKNTLSLKDQRGHQMTYPLSCHWQEKL